MKTHFLLLISLLMLASSCQEKDPITPCTLNLDQEGLRFFEFAHEKGNFIAWTSNAEVIDLVLHQLSLPEAQRGQHINGRIDRLPEGCNSNKNWSWYFVPEEWSMADFSIELCDGNPQYVEENLDEYIRIEAYCPWGSYVLREVSRP